MSKKAGYKMLFTAPARGDIRDVMEWSRKHFGRAAAERYDALLTQAMDDISENPIRPGAKQRATISPGLWVYHLQFSRDRAVTESGIVKQPRHFLVYRIVGSVIRLLRILHDSRDLARHIPGASD